MTQEKVNKEQKVEDKRDKTTTNKNTRIKNKNENIKRDIKKEVKKENVNKQNIKRENRTKTKKEVERGKRNLESDKIFKKSKLKIIPLGGLHEVGKNITVFEYEDEIIIVDCGLSFPEDDMLGIDLVIPDITYLLKNKRINNYTWTWRSYRKCSIFIKTN